MAKKIPNIKPSQPWQRFEVGRTILYKVRWIKNILLLHKYHSRIIFTVLPRFRSNRTKGQEFSKNFLNKVLFDLNRKQFRIHLIYRYAKCRVGMQDQSICNYIGCVLLMHFTLLCAKPTPRPIKGKQAFECCFLVFFTCLCKPPGPPKGSNSSKHSERSPHCGCFFWRLFPLTSLETNKLNSSCAWNNTLHTKTSKSARRQIVLSVVDHGFITLLFHHFVLSKFFLTYS